VSVEPSPEGAPPPQRETLRQRARHVVAVDRDPTDPRRPLHLTIPGGVIAIVAFVAATFVVWRTWWEESLPIDTARPLLIVLAAVFVGATFVFSYGWRLYDVKRALALTAFLTFFGAAIVALLAVVLIALKDADLDLDFGGDGHRNGGGGDPLRLESGGGSGGDEDGTAPTICPSCGRPTSPSAASPCPRCGWPAATWTAPR